MFRRRYHLGAFRLLEIPRTSSICCKLDRMAAHPNRTRWLRYLLSGTVLGLLLTVIFYQPIFFGLARFIAQQVANSQNLTIEFKAHGSIFTDLTLENIEVRPKPGNTVFPIEQLVVKRIAAHYNLGRIFQHRIADIVDAVVARGVELGT